MAESGAPRPVLEIRDVVKTYATGRGLFGAGGGPRLTAVDHVSLTLRPGQTLGLVGESGCGKSTLAKMMVAIEKPTSGSILVRGQDLTTVGRSDLKAARRDIQLVFQDPYSCLDPRLTVADLVGEPLAIHPELVPRARREARVRALLSLVGLSGTHAQRRPHQLSGGQRQRVGIARALALEPSILVLDEPVSALDMSVQAQIVNLLSDLQRRLDLAYVFIAHDLGVVAHLADEVAVMYLGRIVERGPYDVVLSRPEHPFTIALLSAIPDPDPAHRDAFGRRLLAGDSPAGGAAITGCRFRPRCWRATDRCATDDPQLRPAADDPAHLIACHHPGPDAAG